MFKSINSLIINTLFVTIQFGGIGIILLTGPLFCSNPGLFVVQSIGLVLAIWSILIMRVDNLSVFPKIKENAQFVNKGPYRLIRHPMYLSIILAIGPLIIVEFTLLRIIVFALVLVDLIVKLFYEESLLKVHFNHYNEYSKKTFRIIPFLF